MIADTSVMYRFDVRADSKVHKTTIIIEEDQVVTSCTCKTSETKKSCWHAKYILAGRSRRLSRPEASAQQSKLLTTLSKTATGQQLIEEAQSIFIRKESCRRCSSSNVISLKRSVWGRIVGLLKPDSHSLYCKSCKWSW